MILWAVILSLTKPGPRGKAVVAEEAGADVAALAVEGAEAVPEAVEGAAAVAVAGTATVEIAVAVEAAIAAGRCASSFTTNLSYSLAGS